MDLVLHLFLPCLRNQPEILVGTKKREKCKKSSRRAKNRKIELLKDQNKKMGKNKKIRSVSIGEKKLNPNGNSYQIQNQLNLKQDIGYNKTSDLNIGVKNEEQNKLDKLVETVGCNVDFNNRNGSEEKPEMKLEKVKKLTESDLVAHWIYIERLSYNDVHMQRSVCNQDGFSAKIRYERTLFSLNFR